MSALKIAVASVIALSLVLGVALPALADADEPMPWTDDFQLRVVKGTVTEVDQGNQAYFKVQSGDDEIGIRVDENTRYFLLDGQGTVTALLQQSRTRNQEQAGAAGEHAFRLKLQNQAEVNVQEGQGVAVQERVQAVASVQNQARVRVQNRVSQTETVPLPQTYPEIIRPSGAEAEFSDIEVGDRVVVWLASGEKLAKSVLIKKPEIRDRVSGVITGVSLETIEITPEDGRPVTLRYNQDTVFVLNGFISVEERQLACAVYDSEHMLVKKVAVHLPAE
jgi:hypothetical protein